MKSKVTKLIDRLSPDILNFAQQLIQTPSFTGQEGSLAKLVMSKMTELDYDHVSGDALGNVIGIIGNGPTGILFDSHMDTVGVSHPKEWCYDWQSHQ